MCVDGSTPDELLDEDELLLGAGVDVAALADSAPPSTAPPIAPAASRPAAPAQRARRFGVSASFNFSSSGVATVAAAVTSPSEADLSGPEARPVNPLRAPSGRTE